MAEKKISELTAASLPLSGDELVAVVQDGGTRSAPASALFGEQGPQGETGPTGPEGPQGPQGTGLTILGSLADPGDLPPTGDAGDGWLIDGDLYVWTGTEWENVGSIQGPQGIQGIQGVKGDTGDTGPAGLSAYAVAVAEGFVGDEAAWLASLVGPQGEQGVQGIQGEQGEQGEQGVQGEVGETGPQGAAGLSAYEVAVTEGFVGDEAAWLASLVGPEGPQGETGPKGDTGDTGPKGDTGDTGPKGDTGDTGPAGPTASGGDATNNIGYLNIPLVPASTATLITKTHAGGGLKHPSADTTARTFTIDSNANQSWVDGTAITVWNQNAAGVVTLAVTTDTMRLAGVGTTGSRTLAANSIATVIWDTATATWGISGPGVS